MNQYNKGVSNHNYRRDNNHLEEEGISREGVEIVPSDAEGENVNDRSNPFLQSNNSNVNMMLSSEGNYVPENQGQIEGQRDTEDDYNYDNQNSNKNYNLNYNYDVNQDREHRQKEDEENYIKSAKKNEDNNYKEMLEQKVRKQAKRLCELQEYKSLCEKRIGQLSPGHPFPIVDSHLQNADRNTSKASLSQETQFNNMLQSQKFQIQDLTNKLVNKENELIAIHRKYQLLENKYNNYLNESVPKTILQNLNKKSSLNQENIFPAPDRLPNEKMREAYSKIFAAYRESSREKENLMNILRQETINNDEQRNYIEILKQTIESNLVKFGLPPLLEKQKSLHYKSSNPNDIDVLIDIVQLKNEADRVKKELIHSDVLVNELKQEIEFLSETNNEMNLKKEKIRSSLENGIRELEEAKEKVKALESEKFYLQDEFNELREYNDSLVKEYESTLEKNVLMEKELEKIQMNTHEQVLLENKLAEYKNNFEKMSQELDKIINEKEELEINIKKYLEEIEKLKSDIKNITNENDILKISSKDLEDKNNSLQKSNDRLNNKNDDLNSNLNNSLKLLSENERNYDHLFSEYEKTKIALNEYVEKYPQLESNYNNLISEKELISSELNKFKTENLQILVENDKFRLELNNSSNNFNKIFEQYDTLNKNYKNLEMLYNSCKMEKENLTKEINLIKEKNNTDEYNKTKELSKLNTQLNLTKTEKLEIENYFNSEINKLKEELSRNIFERNESEKIILREFNNFKIKSEEILKEKNMIEIENINKEKYINSLEDEMTRREKSKNSLSNMDGAFHEVKLAIHSCLSVANVFMQKYNNTYNKSLDESFSNFNNNNNNNSLMLDSLRNLEEWLNVICRELDTCYSRIQNSQDKLNKESQTKLAQLTDDYNNLYKSNEKLQKELKSFKNDNKKLYDQYKKYQEESVKNILIQNENKFYDSLLSKIINSMTNKELSKNYNEIININSIILTIEKERIKLQKRIDFIEKELQRNVVNKNPELENTMFKEIENLRQIINECEFKINEKREKILLLEKEIKTIEEKTYKESAGINVFKANYVDRTNNTNISKNDKMDYDSRRFYRNFEVKKLSELSKENINYDDSEMNNISTGNYTMNPPSTNYFNRIKEDKVINNQGYN